MNPRDLPPASVAALPTGTGWAARLDLAFERRAQRTVLAHVRHEGPLTVQRALHPEGPSVPRGRRASAGAASRPATR
jgi:hypothetical protein